MLVTGNSEFTLTVLTGLLALTVSPFYLLLVDTRGDTVDMAMVYRSFTPQRLDQALKTHHLAARLSHRQLIIPGVAGSPERGAGRLLPAGISGLAPICAAELPLFLGEGSRCRGVSPWAWQAVLRDVDQPWVNPLVILLLDFFLPLACPRPERHIL